MNSTPVVEGFKTDPVALSGDEVQAIMATIGFSSGLEEDRVAAGRDSLVSRNLLLTDGADLRPADFLAGILAPVLLPEETLTVARATSPESPQVCVARRGAYVSVVPQDPGGLELQAFDVRSMAEFIVSSIADHEGTLTAGGEVLPAELAALHHVITDSDSAPPPVQDVVIILVQKTGGITTQAIVLKHSEGYSWIEGEGAQESRAAIVQADADLAELVMHLLVGGPR